MRTVRQMVWIAIIFGTLPPIAIANASPYEANQIDSSILDLLVQEQEIVSASRHEQSLTDAPAHASVTTREEIELFGYQSIADVLRDQVGLIVNDDLNYHKVGVRGFAPFGDYGSRILLMVDGHPIVEPVMSMGFFERNQPVSLESVERIEVVRGPGSALYGTNAVLAVINIVTRKPASSSPASLGLTWTEAGGGELAFGLSYLSESGYGLRVNGSYSDIDGFDYYFAEFDDPPANDGRAADIDREKTWNIDAILTRRNLSLRALFSYREKQIPTASYECIFGDPRLKTVDRVGYFEASHTHNLSDQIHLKSVLSFDYFRYKGIWPWDDDEGKVYVFEDPRETRIATAESNLFVSSIPRNTLVIGAVLRSTLKSEFSAYDVSPEYFEYFKTRKSKNDFDLFVQDEISMLEGRLSSIIGIRYHHCKLFGNVLSPRLGVMLTSPLGKTKVLYGRSFRNPSLYETYYQDVTDECDDGETLANPDLDAETADTYELVHHARIKGIDATVGLYQYTIRDLIQQLDIGDRCLQYHNSGEVRSRGLEATLTGKFLGKIIWSAGWSKSFLDLKQSRQDYTQKMSYPDELATLRFGLPIARRTLIGFTTRYIGERETKSGQTLKPVWVSDASITLRNFLKGMSFSISATNIFDADFLAPASTEHRQEALPQAIRHVRAKISWELGNE